MKKKILLISVMVMLFATLFAIGVNAENKIIKLSECPTLEQIHADRSAYVSTIDALEEETTYKTTDPDSVVVLSDLAETPTYYVYPCYYFIKSSSYNIAGNVSKFNEAIAKADSTAFAGYKSEGGSWANGECDNLIRIEVPKYVTQITANCKPSGSANLKEMYFPVHTVVEDGVEKTVPYCASVSGQDQFSNCTNLEVIHNQKYLPAGLVQGNNAGFTGCTKLKEFTIPEGVTSIPARFFNGCSALTELTLPNTVKSAGKMAFASCTSLRTFNFGAGFTSFYANNNDFEHFLGSSSVKYFYLPNNDFLFKYDSGTESTRFYNIFGAGSNVTFFYTGTAQEAKALQDRFIASGGNKNFENATILEYDPNVNYEGYADTLGKSIIVCNYNKCDAFYNSNHKIEADVDNECCGICENCKVKQMLPENEQVHKNVWIFNGGEDVSFTVAIAASCECKYCGKVEKTENIGAILTTDGYSVENGGTGVYQQTKINKIELQKYTDITGEEFDYGIFAGIAALDEGNPLVNGANGIEAVEKTVFASFANTEYTLLQIKVTGLVDGAKIYCGAYIMVGEDIVYLSDKTQAAFAKMYTATIVSE